MSDTSALVTLSIMNWLHLIATVAWIGGIITNMFVVVPTARENLEPPVMSRFMGAFTRRLRLIIYISMGILVVTGVFMMIFNKYYLGLFGFGNIWTLFVVIKHILVVILIIMGIYILQFLFPKIGQLSTKGPSPQLAELQKRQMLMGMASIGIAALILLFTGISGAISALP